MRNAGACVSEKAMNGGELRKRIETQPACSQPRMLYHGTPASG